MVDPKTPLFRYVSFDRFNQMLFSKELALMKPSKWDDEYELYWLKMLDTLAGKGALQQFAERFPGEKQINIEKINYLCKMVYGLKYCLCFSNQKDSEVMWRARSDDSKGIMFATTAEKVLALFPNEGYSKNIEIVQYDLESNDLERFLSNIRVTPEGTSMFDTDRIYLHKRTVFSYEQEVRLLVSPFSISKNEIIKVPIPVLSDFVDGVMVHPLARNEHVKLVELLCKYFDLSFCGRSTVYDFAPL